METEFNEDEFMDFGKVDDPGYAKELNALLEIANNSDMTEEEYEKQKEEIMDKYSKRNRGI